MATKDLQTLNFKFDQVMLNNLSEPLRSHFAKIAPKVAESKYFSSI